MDKDLTPRCVDRGQARIHSPLVPPPPPTPLAPLRRRRASAPARRQPAYRAQIGALRAVRSFMPKLTNRGRLATRQIAPLSSYASYATRYSVARVMQSARRKGRCGAAWRENGGDLTGFGRSNESEGRSGRASGRCRERNE